MWIKIIQTHSSHKGTLNSKLGTVELSLVRLGHRNGSRRMARALDLDRWRRLDLNREPAPGTDAQTSNFP